MSKLGKYHWAALFILIFVVFLGTVRATKPRVLVLYSSSKGSLVTQYLKSGIEEALSINRVPVSVRQHYMGLDNKLTVEQADREAVEAFDMVQHFAPDVLMISGHDANKLMAPKIAALSSQIWVVPFAVEAAPEAMTYHNVSKVVGVIRKLPIVGIADFFAEIHGHKAVNVSILGADTAGNRLRMENLSQGVPSNMRVTSKFLSNCFDEWQKYVHNLSGKTHLLLILPTVTLQERCIPASPMLAGDKFIPWIETNSRALPVGTEGSFVKNGGAVSFYPSYKEEGLLAMDQAMTLINPNRKEPPKQIYTESYQVALNASRLRVRNISVPSIYVQYGQKSGLNYRDSD